MLRSLPNATVNEVPDINAAGTDERIRALGGHLRIAASVPILKPHVFVAGLGSFNINRGRIPAYGGSIGRIDRFDGRRKGIHQHSKVEALSGRVHGRG